MNPKVEKFDLECSDIQFLIDEDRSTPAFNAYGTKYIVHISTQQKPVPMNDTSEAGTTSTVTGGAATGATASGAAATTTATTTNTTTTTTTTTTTSTTTTSTTTAATGSTGRRRRAVNYNFNTNDFSFVSKPYSGSYNSLAAKR